MDPLSKNIFELVLMLVCTWKFPWTLSVRNFLISLNVTGYMEISMDPLGNLTFLNNVSLNVTGYMEMSLHPFGKEFLI